MALHNEIGKQGEELAVDFLVKNNFKILNRNWRLRKFEVDIIAEQNNELVFIEVKARTSIQAALNDLFPYNKQKQLMNALHEYCILNNIQAESRIDALLVDMKSFEVYHYPNFIRL